jgi:2-hydroxychromene-2-carboxylate isomerase
MLESNTIDFWFTVGSTYTYLTASRLHEVEASSGIRFPMASLQRPRDSRR